MGSLLFTLGGFELPFLVLGSVSLLFALLGFLLPRPKMGSGAEEEEVFEIYHKIGFSSG